MDRLKGNEIPERTKYFAAGVASALIVPVAGLGLIKLAMPLVEKIAGLVCLDSNGKIELMEQYCGMSVMLFGTAILIVLTASMAASLLYKTRIFNTCVRATALNAVIFPACFLVGKKIIDLG